LDTSEPLISRRNINLSSLAPWLRLDLVNNYYYYYYIYKGECWISTCHKQLKEEKHAPLPHSPFPLLSSPGQGKVVRLESITPRLSTAMTKVYPNVAPAAAANEKQRQLLKLKSSNNALDADHAVVLTVWKKSLLFNCNGYTVFDSKGNLLFRVDNYMATSGSNGEIVLMDAAGKPLLTMRRKVYYIYIYIFMYQLE